MGASARPLGLQRGYWLFRGERAWPQCANQASRNLLPFYHYLHPPSSPSPSTHTLCSSLPHMPSKPARGSAGDGKFMSSCHLAIIGRPGNKSPVDTQQLLGAAGGKVVEQVTKATHVLIAEKPSVTPDVKAAQAKGIPLVSYRWLKASLVSLRRELDVCTPVASHLTSHVHALPCHRRRASGCKTSAAIPSSAAISPRRPRPHQRATPSP